MRAVPSSPEFRRIRDLPRRPDLATIPDLTPLFRREGGTMTMRRIQSRALLEMETCKGAFLPVGVSHGKTLIGLLAARALDAKRLVYVTKASLVGAVREVELPKYSQHFEIPLDRIAAFISYEDLSSHLKPKLLEELQPDAFYFDEASELKRMGSVKCVRVRHWLKTHPKTKVVAASGSFSDGSLRDWAHLCKWCLGLGAPVPVQSHFALDDWSAALDANPMVRIGPGKLLHLCGHDHSGDSDPAHRNFRCRLVSTPGVVATEESALGTSLLIRRRRVVCPDEVDKVLEIFRETWEFGDIVAADVLSFYRIAHQLSMGFFYRQVWPEGKVDEEWQTARRDWAHFARKWLRHNAKPGLDSEGLLIAALESGQHPLKPICLPIWEAWRKVRKRKGPAIEPVWFSSFIFAEVEKFVSEGNQGIVWYRDRAVGEKLARFMPVFGEGAGLELAKAEPTTYPYLAVSMKAHKMGQNLQAWNRNLVLGMANAKGLEQLLARTHRLGQTADLVLAEVLLHTKELQRSFDNAREQAHVIEATFGTQQKLNFADMDL